MISGILANIELIIYFSVLVFMLVIDVILKTKGLMYKDNKEAKSTKKTIITFIYYTVALLLVVLVLVFDKRIKTLRSFDSVQSAMSSLGVTSSSPIIIEDDKQLYFHKIKDDGYRFVEYRKINNRWKVIYDFDQTVSSIYRLNDDSVQLYLNVYNYTIDNKLVIYMICTPFKSKCDNVEVVDNQNNTFKVNKEDYKIIENILKDDYRFTYDGKEYNLDEYTYSY